MESRKTGKVPAHHNGELALYPVGDREPHRALTKGARATWADWRLTRAPHSSVEGDRMEVASSAGKL